MHCSLYWVPGSARVSMHTPCISCSYRPTDRYRKRSADPIFLIGLYRTVLDPKRDRGHSARIDIYQRYQFWYGAYRGDANQPLLRDGRGYPDYQYPSWERSNRPITTWTPNGFDRIPFPLKVPHYQIGYDTGTTTLTLPNHPDIFNVAIESMAISIIAARNGSIRHQPRWWRLLWYAHPIRFEYRDSRSSSDKTRYERYLKPYSQRYAIFRIDRTPITYRK